MGGGLAPEGHEVDLAAGDKWLLNPGSVGQPRDGDPRAAYLVLDLDARRATFRRVPYPVERTQAEILEHGLPEAACGSPRRRRVAPSAPPCSSPAAAAAARSRPQPVFPRAVGTPLADEAAAVAEALEAGNLDEAAAATERLEAATQLALASGDVPAALAP